MSRLILDAGAFVAYERAGTAVRTQLAVARRLEDEVVTTSPVVAQVWRDGRRQAVLAKLLASTRIDAPDEASARRAGELLARTRTRDVVDALVVGLARDGDTILTSDPDDLAILLAVTNVSAEIIRV